METTNFFSSVAALQITGVLQLYIKKATDNNWVVSVLLENEQCGDKAKELIPRLNLNGTADELDRNFFAKISTPIEAASGLMVDMETFMKQLELAKKHSAMEKEKAERERKEKETKEKKYNEAMRKVEELEKEGKFRDAWMKVPEPSGYPEQAEALRKRKSALAARFAPDLFAADAVHPQQGEINGDDMPGTDPDEEWDDDNETGDND